MGGRGIDTHLRQREEEEEREADDGEEARREDGEGARDEEEEDDVQLVRERQPRRAYHPDAAVEAPHAACRREVIARIISTRSRRAGDTRPLGGI